MSCGEPIDEMHQISIILNGLIGQYGNVVAVIHVTRNPYYLTSVSLVLDAKPRLHGKLFGHKMKTPP